MRLLVMINGKLTDYEGYGPRLPNETKTNRNVKKECVRNCLGSSNIMECT